MGHTEAHKRWRYRLIEHFANYGFNRSCLCLCCSSFQIAYFKANYPDEFMRFSHETVKERAQMQDALDNDFQMEQPSTNWMPYHDRVEMCKIASFSKCMEHSNEICGILDC